MSPHAYKLTNALCAALASLERAAKRARECLSTEWSSAGYLEANGHRIGPLGRRFPRCDYFFLGSGRASPFQTAADDQNSTAVSREALPPDEFYEFPDRRVRFARKLQTYLNPSTNRPTFFGQIEADSGLGLEIGPLHAPICKKDVFQVRYIDAFSTEELKTKYANDPGVASEDIAELDYVWRGEPYGQLMTERFDFVVTSHNIEHVPCLISFLHNLESCLKQNGRVFLAIPDKRYCFDHFKSESSIDEVLSAYSEKREKPSPRQIVRHELLQTHNDSRRHWQGDHGTPSCLNGSEHGERSLRLLRVFGSDGAYHDTHCWIFTPGSFAEIMEFLEHQKLVKLELTSLFPTEPNSHEFYAILTMPRCHS
jgi:hypothetical protein